MAVITAGAGVGAAGEMEEGGILVESITPVVAVEEEGPGVREEGAVITPHPSEEPRGGEEKKKEGEGEGVVHHVGAAAVEVEALLLPSTPSAVEGAAKAPPLPTPGVVVVPSLRNVLARQQSIKSSKAPLSSSSPSFKFGAKDIVY